MNSNILLINPWITDFAAYDFWLKPLGILYIAGFLRKYNYKLTLIDCMDRYDSDLLAFQGIDSPKNRYDSTGKFYREIIAKPSAYQNIPRNFARYGFPLEVFRHKLRRCVKPDVVLMTAGMTYWYPGVQLAIKEVRKMYPNAPVVLGGIYPTLCRKHAIEKSGADLVISGAGELAALKVVDMLTDTKRNYDNFNDNLDELPYPAFDLYKNLGYVT
ncbi:MAG: cobalamin-dependent protein, partial [bacterium]